ncbi:MAG: hypothetical protein WC628_08125 [Candidatus Omnitrophota bacterium]
MADGGFLVKFDGKEITRCYAVAFDYDLREYTVNGKEAKPLPEDVEAITVIVERL